MSLLLKCVTCGGKVSQSADKCPNCGEPEFSCKTTCSSCEGKGYHKSSTNDFRPSVPTGGYDVEAVPESFESYRDYERVTCGTCYGKGEITPWFGKPYKCPNCEYGKRKAWFTKTRKVNDSYYRYKYKCNSCDGTGQVLVIYNDET